jgi:hypothetical protein
MRSLQTAAVLGAAALGLNACNDRRDLTETLAKGAQPLTADVSALRPVLECVELSRNATGIFYIAHFGYQNDAAATTVSPLSPWTVDNQAFLLQADRSPSSA